MPDSLLVLTQHYRPEPNFITADVAERLADLRAVTVVTAHPNYPDGRFYAGTRYWWPARSVERGVTVWRVPMVPYHGRGKLARFVSYLSFALAAGLVAPWVAGRPAVVWVYHGPFTTALAAIWFRLRGARVVFTAADLWPESFLAAGVAGPGLVMRAMFSYSRIINRLAHMIICSTRGTLDRYRADGLPPGALCHVPVWVEATPAPREAVAADEPAAIVYAGNLGPAQQLETLIDAAALLQARGTRVRFHLLGTGASEHELRLRAEAAGADNIVFHGRVPPQEAARWVARAAGQVVSLRRGPLFAMTIPSKLTFAFAAGVPILYGLEGEPAALVRESGGGIAFDPGDPASLVDAVEVLVAKTGAQREDMGRRLTAFYETHFERGLLLERYAELLGGDMTSPMKGAA